MSDAADKRLKAMIKAYDPDGEDPDAEAPMKDLVAVLDAWVAHTDFIETIKPQDPGAALYQSRRFRAVPRSDR